MSNNIVIRNLDPQEITIQEGGTISGITNVYVNGTDVTIGTKAYVIVPTKLSELTNDEGFITNAEETDPTVPSYVKNITQANINSWNNKQDQLVSTQNIKSINGNSILGSGNLNITNEYEAGTGIDITGNVISNTITSYDDLTDTPIIPTSVSQLSNDSGYVTKYVDDLSYYLSTSELEKILPKVSDSGSDLYLEDSAAFRMDIKLKPHEIEQHTTEGKNILNIQTIVKGRLDSGVLGYASNTTDLTLNDNDFSFTTDTNYRGATTDYIAVEEDDYIFNSETPNSSYGFTCACYDNDKVFLNNANVTVEVGGTKRSFTLTSSVKYIRIYFALNTAGTITFNNPQLEQGSTVTTYEEYTGGMPSPNPLYPQDIHVTTGENSITIMSKNLFIPTIQVNGTNIVMTNGTVTLNEDEFELSATGSDCYFGQVLAASGTYTDNRGVLIDVEGVDNITFSLTNSDLNNHFITAYDSNKISLGYTQFSGVSSGTYSIPSGAKYITLRFGKSNAVPGNSYKTKVQIEKGSTATSYVPYQTQEYPIDLSEDYLKLDDISDRLYRNIPSDPDYDSRYENGKWWIRQNVYPVYLAYIGDFTDVEDNGDKYSFYNNNATDVPRRDVCENPYGKSIYFNNVADGNNNIIESTGTNTVRIDIDKKVGISTVEQLNQWINDNQVVVYFPLISSHFYAKGTVNETLNTELNDLTENNTAYEGGTNITQENDDLPFDVEASVFKMIS